MPSTKRELENILGGLTTSDLSNLILEIADQNLNVESTSTVGFELAVPVTITNDAYDALRNTFEGVSDEHIMRLLIEYLRDNQ